jgi:hypothetical protein
VHLVSVKIPDPPVALSIPDLQSAAASHEATVRELYSLMWRNCGVVAADGMSAVLGVEVWSEGWLQGEATAHLPAGAVDACTVGNVLMTHFCGLAESCRARGIQFASFRVS